MSLFLTKHDMTNIIRNYARIKKNANDSQSNPSSEYLPQIEEESL